MALAEAVRWGREWVRVRNKRVRERRIKRNSEVGHQKIKSDYQMV